MHNNNWKLTQKISPSLFISRKIIPRNKKRRNSKFGPNYSIFTPRLSFPHYWIFFPPLGGIPFSSSAVSTKMRPIWIKGRVRGRKGRRKRRPGVPLKKVICNCRFATSCVVVVSIGFVIKKTSFIKNSCKKSHNGDCVPTFSMSSLSNYERSLFVLFASAAAAALSRLPYFSGRQIPRSSKRIQSMQNGISHLNLVYKYHCTHEIIINSVITIVSPKKYWLLLALAFVPLSTMQMGRKLGPKKRRDGKTWEASARQATTNSSRDYQIG